MIRRKMVAMAGLVLAMGCSANGQEGKHTLELKGVPVRTGTEPPRVLSLEVAGINSGVAVSGTTLTITYKLQESAGNLPLSWALLARMSAKEDRTIDQGVEADRKLVEGTVDYKVPEVKQQTELTLVFELINSRRQREAAGVNNKFVFTAVPAATPAPSAATAPPPATTSTPVTAGTAAGASVAAASTDPATTAVEALTEPKPNHQLGEQPPRRDHNVDLVFPEAARRIRDAAASGVNTNRLARVYLDDGTVILTPRYRLTINGDKATLPDGREGSLTRPKK